MNIAVIGGGNSGEREVSLKSLSNICEQLSDSEYSIYPLVLTDTKIAYLTPSNKQVFIDLNDFSLSFNKKRVTFDFVFNTIHGTPGEDGLIQGYLDFLNIPYNGSSVLVSALTFNKQVCKYVLQGVNGVFMANSMIMRGTGNIDINKLESCLDYPMFVKPNKGGSSVGISKVRTKKELEQAISLALKEDDEVLVEEFIEGVEITCGVYRKNFKAKALAVTEIDFKSDFFDYDAKYNSSLTNEITPARISDKLYKECMDLSERLYTFLECKGITRMDYIVKDEKLFLIEVNTIPGMSKESIIPRQLKHVQLTLNNLIKESLLEL